MKTLGIYTFVHNVTDYDYPIEESLNSALPIANKIVILECSSTDNTLERLKSWASSLGEKSSDVQIIHGMPWITHFTQLSSLANLAAQYCTTDWKWHLQADEVIHEDSYEYIQHIIEHAPENITALSVNYTHMLANFETEFDFCYKRAIRIARGLSNWHLIGDACQLDGESIDRVYNSDIQVFHYGKVHSYETGFKKESDFQELFRDIGFPDPKMKEMKTSLQADKCDYLYLFKEDIKNGKVRKFTGTHPKVMQERIKKFKDNGWEQFQSIMDNDIKI